MLEGSINVDWWYKNGEAKQQYFAITYQTTDEETGLVKLASFYPDYIVRYLDGVTGIYDTKSGHTTTERATYDKSDALQAYVIRENVQGGILNKRADGIFIFNHAEYTPELTQ